MQFQHAFVDGCRTVVGVRSRAIEVQRAGSNFSQSNANAADNAFRDEVGGGCAIRDGKGARGNAQIESCGNFSFRSARAKNVQRDIPIQR